MKFENIFKSIVTTLIGTVIMATACYKWYLSEQINLQLGIALAIGFAMLWMRDSLPGFITTYFNSKFGQKKPE